MPYIEKKDREKFDNKPEMFGLSCMTKEDLVFCLENVVLLYIDEDRTSLDFIKCSRPSSVGELNYFITKICHGYLMKLGMIKYQRINDIVGAISVVEKQINNDNIDVLGALECAKLEFYRRLVAVYEDVKIRENGDV